MIHIFCHNKAGYCAGRTKHNDNGNQLILCEAAADGQREKKCFVASFIKVQATEAFSLEKAFPKRREPPMAIRPRGVAVFARFPTVESRIFGNGRRSRDHNVPAAIPRIIGLVMMPFKVRFRTTPFSLP